MFVTLATRGQSARAINNQARGMETGIGNIRVPINSSHYKGHYDDAIRATSKGAVNESDVTAQTKRAAEAEQGTKLRQDWLNQRKRELAAVTGAHKADIGYQVALAQQSQQLGQAQHGAVRQLAGIGYQAGLQNAETAGIMSAYQSGYSRSRRGF